MMKPVFWFAALLVTLSGGAVDVEKTVQQVQSILKSNTLLPRLSRDEIIQLLNDIRAEDAKGDSASKQNLKILENKKLESDENEIKYVTESSDIKENTVSSQIDVSTLSILPTTNLIESTTQGQSKITVVLPYTPRDGSSLQELYTRPPRVEVVSEPKVIKKPISNMKLEDSSNKILANNNEVDGLFKKDLPAELHEFLNSLGIKSVPGQDNYLLPLQGFKPLPPAKVVDGSVQLPENILLAYDLITPSDSKPSSSNKQEFMQNNFFYEPLPPKFPFELDTSPSEVKDTVFPLDLPKSRQTKAASVQQGYEPIDYDSIKVIPLNKGPSPIDDEKVIFNTEQNKRQANTTESDTNNNTTTTEESISITNEFKDTDASANSDAGASLSDLEASFGGAAPQEPGDSVLPPPRKNGFYWMLDWNSFLEVGDGDTKVNIRFEPKLGDPQMFLPVNVP